VADSQENVRNLLSKLPPLFWRNQVVANCCFHWSAAWIDVSLNAEGELRYHLRVAGSPQYVQRQRLGEIEQALAMAVSRL
jgi:hypothetical protein